MIARLQISYREATAGDKKQLANLIHFEPYVHRHLDWRPALDWVGYHPYRLAEMGDRLVAALACPPEPPNVAWIRLFAASNLLPVDQAWELLWSDVLDSLALRDQHPVVAAIPLQRWFQNLLEESEFEQTHRVIMLDWKPGKRPEPKTVDGVTVRPMNYDDLAEVAVVDHAAFPSLWHSSQSCLELAFSQAAVATIAEMDGRMLAYQISTATPMGGHLARLAVSPRIQGRGIGYLLVDDLLAQFERKGAHSLTVNTQHDNLASLALYEKAGFRRTGEEYPVYQYSRV